MFYLGKYIFYRSFIVKAGKYGRVTDSGKYGKYTIPLAVCDSGKIYLNMIIKLF